MHCQVPGGDDCGREHDKHSSTYHKRNCQVHMVTFEENYVSSGCCDVEMAAKTCINLNQHVLC